MRSSRFHLAIAVAGLAVIALGFSRAVCAASGVGGSLVAADRPAAITVASAGDRERARQGGRSMPGDAVPAREAQSDGSCRLSGICRDTSGRALAGVRVAAFPPASRGETLSVLLARGATALTDSAGAFELVVPRDVASKLVARADGFLVEARLLASSAAHTQVDLVLTPGGSIQGTVRTRDGTPIVGARLVARGRGAHGDAVGPHFVAAEQVDLSGAWSGDDGAFAISGLRSGKFVVEVRAPGYRRTEPLPWGESLIVACGDRVDVVLDPVGIVHAIAVDAANGDVVKSARFSTLPASADHDEAWFSPTAAQHSTSSGARMPFLFGPPGAELCLLGVEPAQLPGAPEMDGHYLQVGECSAWTRGTAAKLRVAVTAPGYADAEADLPVAKFEFGSVPAAVRVELVRRDAVAFSDVPVKFQFVGDAGESEAGLRREIIVALTRETDPGAPKRSGGVRSRTRGSGAGPGLPPDVVAEVERRLQRTLDAVSAGRAERLTRRVQLDEQGLGVLSALQPGRYTVSDINGLESVTFTVPGDAAPVRLAVAGDAVSERLYARWNGHVYIEFRDAAGAPLPGVGVRLEADPSTTSELGGPVSWSGMQVLPPGSTHGSAPLRFDLPPADVTFVLTRPGYTEQRILHRVAGRGVVETIRVTMTEE